VTIAGHQGTLYILYTLYIFMIISDYPSSLIITQLRAISVVAASGHFHDN
jgi:hypothetical protein